MNGRLQRGIIIVPSALTLANLFFGVWAIVSASRGDFITAAWLVVIASVADLLDGRVARVTRTGSRFGEELDSLVDAISFGVAPALIIYYLFLGRRRLELDRGVLLRHLRGHPAGALQHRAGGPGQGRVPRAALALGRHHARDVLSVQPDGVLPDRTLAAGRGRCFMTALMFLLGMLMMSHVLYPVLPKFGFRTPRGFATLVGLVLVAAAALTIPALFFFPACIAYVSYGVLKAFVLGFFERLPDRDMLLDDGRAGRGGRGAARIDYESLAPPPARLVAAERAEARAPGVGGRPARTPQRCGGIRVNRYVVEVRITPREGLLDPEGKAVENALRSLEFGGVRGCPGRAAWCASYSAHPRRRRRARGPSHVPAVAGQPGHGGLRD